MRVDDTQEGVLVPENQIRSASSANFKSTFSDGSGLNNYNGLMHWDGWQGKFDRLRLLSQI